MDALKFMEFEGHTRGVNLKNILDYVKYKKGKNGINDIFSILEMHNINLSLTDDVDEKYWYPLYYEFLILEVACNVLGGNTDLRAAEIGKYGVENIGFLRFFVRLAMNPNSLAKRAQKDWNMFYDFGVFDVLKNDVGEIVVEIQGMPYFGLYASNLQGFFSGIMEIAGINTYNVEHVGHYRYVVNW